MRGYQGPIVVLASAVALCACSNSHRNADPTAGVAPSATGTNRQVLESHRFGFRIEYPKGWTTRRDFRGSYLANGSWKTYAPPGSHGTPIAALVVPGSNRITNAEVRIGVSRARGEVESCAKPPASVRGSTDRERIDSADFVTFEAGDAAMSHYLDVDLLVYGTNPQVYEPPATPPFSKDQAFAVMRDVLRTFHFTR